MIRKLRAIFVCACLVLTGTLAIAAVPVSVFPNPVQFGTIPQNSTSNYVSVFVTNTTINPVVVTNMTITGANSAAFAFPLWTCVGTISANQSCQMYMTFTPNVFGSINATLSITISGVTGAVNIPLQGTGGNPIPGITSLSPSSVYVNSATTKVTINGSGFLPSTTVSLQTFNNNNPVLPTTFVSANQITTLVPGNLLSTQGQISLIVSNPQPGGGSNTATLQVIGTAPSISGVNPTSIVAGTPSETIIINGQNFMSGAQLQWNGVNIPTTYISSAQLQAQPSTANLKNAGIVQLTVNNPSPGLLSQIFSFDITYPVTITVLNLPANDLVWDPFTQLIYASLPSSYGVNGNSIAVINPATKSVTGYHFAGSEPDRLALDSNSKFLYVGLDGSGSIQRLNLPAFTPDINIDLGSQQFNGGVNTAAGISVSPTNAHTIAVALGQPGGCCQNGPLQFFTDATKLANSINSVPVNEVIFTSGTNLFAYSQGVLSKVNVTATGGTLGTQWNNLVTGSSVEFAGGLIFGGGGEEFNPATGLLLGSFDVGNTCCNNMQVLPNSTINRAFALGQTPFFNGFGITSYNLAQFTPLAAANLSGVLANPGFNNGRTSNFIQWGPSGLAFILTSGCCGNDQNTQVILLQSPTLLMTASSTANPVPVQSTPSPTSVTHGTGNFRMTLRGTGFVPGSTVMWNGKKFSSSYVSSKQLTVYVPKAAVAAPGTAAVAVKNPSPGGGTSTAVKLTIK